MKELVDSLSLGTGAIVVAALSAAVVWLLCSVLPAALRSLWVYAVPLMLAYSLYWLPVWLGNDPSEYGAWQLIVIGPWFIAGAIASAVTSRIVGNRSNRSDVPPFKP